MRSTPRGWPRPCSPPPCWPGWPSLLWTGHLAKAEPKTIRYRLLHVAARLTHGGRRHYLRIDETWPWVTDLTAAFGRIQALPAGP